MKRLNKKGFTLVELLAVIVILAIVVGITLVTILPTIESSRKQSFDVAVEAIKKYIQDQVDLSVMDGAFEMDNSYVSAIGTAKSGTSKSTDTTNNVLTLAGDYKDNIDEIQWTVSDSGVVSITCATANSTGEYRQSDTYSKCTTE